MTAIGEYREENTLIYNLVMSTIDLSGAERRLISTTWLATSTTASTAMGRGLLDYGSLS